MNTANLLILTTIELPDEKSVYHTIHDWYEQLQKRRGWRAELRRTDDPADLSKLAGFHELERPFRGWVGGLEWRWLGMALAAGVASHVKENDERRSFAAQLGKPLQGSSNPPLSRLRFNQLCQARDVYELYRLVVRAIHHLKGKVNLVSLMDDMLLWSREYDERNHPAPFVRSPFQRPALRWATEYFQATEMTEE